MEINKKLIDAYNFAVKNRIVFSSGDYKEMEKWVRNAKVKEKFMETLKRKKI